MAEIACEMCGRSPQTTGDTVYRANAKGQPARWRCKHHRQDLVIDLELERVVRALEELKKEPTDG